MKYILLTIFILFFFPKNIFAKVYITEIAWMGTSGSQYSEWLELYNDAEETVDLKGWKLYEEGDSLVFIFSKKLPAKTYFLLERTTASSPDAVTGINNEAGSFGGGGLSNSGENLYLKDSKGAVVASIKFASGWPAGDEKTKNTMQWNGQEWDTATATPGKALASQTDPLSDDYEQDEIKTEKTSSTESEKKDEIPKVSPNDPYIKFSIPKTIYSGTPYLFEGQPVLEYNYKIENGSFYWNMGDGTTHLQSHLGPINHIYQFSGVYTLAFVFTDPSNTFAPITAEQKITVLSPSISLSTIDQRAIEIKNLLDKDMDLTGWYVLSSGKKIAIPDRTIIAGNATVAIPFSVLSIQRNAPVSIVDPSGSVVGSINVPTSNFLGDKAKKLVSADVNDSKKIEVTQDAGSKESSKNTPIIETIEDVPRNTKDRTKTFVFGAVLLFVIVLSILLERSMARQE